MDWLQPTGGMYCGCERGNKTVGRVDMATAFGHHSPPPPPPPEGKVGVARRLQAAPEADEDYWQCSKATADLCSPCAPLSLPFAVVPLHTNGTP